MNHLGVAWLQYDFLAEKAAAFLKEHNAYDAVPVDIESIIDRAGL